MAPNVTIVAHPAVQTRIEQLQDRSVPPAAVRALVKGATNVLAVEATLEINPSDKTIIVPVMRSGLAMLDATLELLDSTHNLSVHHLGLFRHSSTLEAVEYYNNIPTEGRAAKYGIIVDPLLATGSTVTAAINSLK
jgi:uracil phosphoribosyltransferase